MAAKIYKDVFNDDYVLLRDTMNKGELTGAISNFLDLLEKHNIGSEQLILVGGGLGVLNDLWKETRDVDWLPIDKGAYNQILEAVSTECKEILFYSCRGYRLVADFKYSGAEHNIFYLDYVSLALQEPFFESEQMNLAGRTIQVRPLRLLYEDYTHGYAGNRNDRRPEILKNYLEQAK